MSKTRKFGPITIRPHKVKGKETGQWVVDIPGTMMRNGKRNRPLKDNRTQAENYARELARRLKFRELGFAKKAPRTSMTLYQGIELWKEEQERRVLKGKICNSTLVTNLNKLLPIKTFFNDCYLTEIIPVQIDKYQIQRLKRGCKEVTINGETSALKQVLKWHCDKGHLDKMPSFENLDVPEVEFDIPEKRDVVQIMRHLPELQRVLVKLMAETGVRPGEAYNLPWKHVNLEKGYISIRQFRDWKPKRKSSIRDVWISSSLCTEMRRLPKAGTYVFSGRDSEKPITSFKRALKTAVELSELERDGHPMRITPKTFRKAFATWQAEDGVSPSILQKQMGHVPGSRMTEQHYIRIRDRALQKAVLELPPNDATDYVAKSGNEDERRGREAA